MSRYLLSFLFQDICFFVKLEHWSWDVFAQKIKKRIGSVFIPYILWNMLTAAFFMLMLFASKHSIESVWNFCSERGWGLMLWNNGRFGESITFVTNIFGVPMHSCSNRWSTMVCARFISVFHLCSTHL